MIVIIINMVLEYAITAVPNLFYFEDPFLCSTEFHGPPHTNIVIFYALLIEKIQNDENCYEISNNCKQICIFSKIRTNASI
jgi:hypothetical protein